MTAQIDPVLALVGAAWLAIALMLAGGALAGLYRLVTAARPLPFFETLQRRGLSAEQLEAAVGAGGFARALRRCALCAGREQCGRQRVECPNESLMRYVHRLALVGPRGASGMRAAPTA
jgi:hypothetical protein